jgi:murein DD-endopeptidase MepM/ murein hydrolase activator NlpD
MGSDRWRRRFAANAAEVIARFSDRIPAFEILPGPNLPGPDGAPRLSEAAYARVLANVRTTLAVAPSGARPVTLVAGAVVLYSDGAGYLARAIAADAVSAAGAVGSDTPAGIPFDAIAAWPALPHDLGHIPAAHLDGQLEALAQALIPFPAVGALPVYVSGVTWKTRSQGDFNGEDIATALSDLQHIRPQVRITARVATESGPFFSMPEKAEHLESFVFAVFTEPELVIVPASRGETPVIDGFDFPVGPRDELGSQPAGYAITTFLADQDYHDPPKFKGAWHPGEDWAALGRCDAGLGDPVYAIADGVVVFQQYCSPSWGRILLIQHTLRNGGCVWSQYAHLDSWLVEEDQVVQRGQQIGTLGKGANNAFCAHLHFEGGAWSMAAIVDWLTRIEHTVSAWRSNGRQHCAIARSSWRSWTPASGPPS